MSRVTADAKQATRRRLLAAAAQEFARAGLERASVDAISLAAGYAKGTIYNYFPSKEELFLAVVEDAPAPAAPSSPPPADTPAGQGGGPRPGAHPAAGTPPGRRRLMTRPLRQKAAVLRSRPTPSGAFRADVLAAVAALPPPPPGRG